MEGVLFLYSSFILFVLSGVSRTAQICILAESEILRAGCSGIMFYQKDAVWR